MKTINEIWASSQFRMSCIRDVRDTLNLDNDTLERVLNFCEDNAVSPYVLIGAAQANCLDHYGLPEDLKKLLKHEAD